MTTEERLDRLEETDRKLTELAADVVAILRHQQEQLDHHQERIDHQQEQLEEIHRDARMTQRLWVRLATKYGWLDDEDSEEDGG